MSFAPIEDLVAAFARGDLVIVVDDADRENEGDLIAKYVERLLEKE